MQIGLCVIATGKYGRFVAPLWESARKYFMTDHVVRLFLFTDESFPIPTDAEVCPTPHRPWPGPTLYRYHAMLAYSEKLEKMDSLYYIDADMLFVAPIGNEILGDLVATRHPGYVETPRDACPYDRNPRSQAFVPPSCGQYYYAGGFQGGRAPCFLEAMAVLRSRIETDTCHSVTAVWHDESHWNRLLIDSPPNVTLSPAYCFPEERTFPFAPKILALNKNHAEMRS